MCFGGGGGGSTGTYYANQDRLFGSQADIANNLYNDYAKNGAPLLQGLAEKAGQGVDAGEYAGLAKADTQSAIDNSTAQMTRQAQSMGVNAGSGNFQSAMADKSFDNAAMLAGSQNKARKDAETLDWGRKTDVANMYRGMPGQAAAGLGAAASGYGQMGQQQQQQNNASAAGYGAAGATMAKAFMKDGGEVRSQGLRMATGGLASVDWRTQPTTTQRVNAVSPMTRMAAGASPVIAGQLAKEYATPYIKQAYSSLKDALMEKVADAPSNYTMLRQPMADMPNVDTPSGSMGSDTGVADIVKPAAEAPTPSPEAPTSAPEMPSTGAETGVQSASPTTTAAPTGAETGAAADAAAAGGEEAAAAAAEEAAAAAAAEAGEAAAAAAAEAAATEAAEQAMMLLLLKNGGSVGLRKNMTPGGHVRGPGGPKDDKVPAMLSNGEYVLNEKAVRMVGKHKLDAINNAGLQARGDKPKLNLRRAMANC